MIKNRKLAIIYLLFLILIFLLNLFVINITSKIELLLIFIVLLIISKFFFKYKRNSVYSKEIIVIVMALIGFLQVGIYYIIGLFSGFSNNAVSMNMNRFLLVILPLIIILVIQEYLRYQMVSKENNNRLFRTLHIILFILMDVNLFGTSVNFRDLDSTLYFFGIIIFPSIVSNIVFDKITMKYGYRPIIIYRIITIVTYYVVPIIPNMNVLLRSICRIVIPLIIYMVISYMFDRVTFENIVKKKRNFSFGTIILIVLIIFMSALISCAFKYGVIAVGSGSMTGAIDIGDIVLFEKYDNQKLEIGDIIIYNKNDKNIIHRITEIGVFNDDYVYVTKGDNNKYVDPGYVYKKNIVGIVHKRIRYLGIPSIWVRSLFNS